MPKADEFYAEAMTQRFNELNALRKRREADLAVSLSENDTAAAAEEIEQIAAIDARRTHLINLANAEHARNQPVYHERESIMTSHRTPVNGDDALEIINAGKMPGDKTRLTVDEYNQQYYKLQNLKAQGHYKTGGN